MKRFALARNWPPGAPVAARRPLPLLLGSTAMFDPLTEVHNSGNSFHGVLVPHVRGVAVPLVHVRQEHVPRRHTDRHPVLGEDEVVAAGNPHLESKPIILPEGPQRRHDAEALLEIALILVA